MCTSYTHQHELRCMKRRRWHQTHYFQVFSWRIYVSVMSASWIDPVSHSKTSLHVSFWQTLFGSGIFETGKFRNSHKRSRKTDGLTPMGHRREVGRHPHDLCRPASNLFSVGLQVAPLYQTCGPKLDSIRHIQKTYRCQWTGLQLHVCTPTRHSLS